MTTLREAAQAALDRIENSQQFGALADEIATVRAALAPPEPEPVAWGCFKDGALLVDLVGNEADVDFWCRSTDEELQGVVKGALYAANVRAKPDGTVRRDGSA
jgi:hypothetical protein